MSWHRKFSQFHITNIVAVVSNSKTLFGIQTRITVLRFHKSVLKIKLGLSINE